MHVTVPRAVPVHLWFLPNVDLGPTLFWRHCSMYQAPRLARGYSCTMLWLSGSEAGLILLPNPGSTRPTLDTFCFAESASASHSG